MELIKPEATREQDRSVIIRAGGLDIPVSAIFEEKEDIDGQSRRLLRVVLEDGKLFTQAQITALKSGPWEILSGALSKLSIQAGFNELLPMEARFLKTDDSAKQITELTAETSRLINEVQAVKAQAAHEVRTAIAQTEKAEATVMRIGQTLRVVADELPDETAVKYPDLYVRMVYEGELIPAGTRINWGGKLKRANVDLWDRVEQNPDNAPNLWSDIIRDYVQAQVGKPYVFGASGIGDTIWRQVPPAGL